MGAAWKAYALVACLVGASASDEQIVDDMHEQIVDDMQLLEKDMAELNPFSLEKANAQPAPNWAMDVMAHQVKYSSQKGQDGVIQYIFSQIGVSNKYFVEYGFNTKNQCEGSGPNSCRLWKNGWKGLLLDGGNENPAINLRKEWLTADTINSIYLKHQVPVNADFISIDVDSSDLWLFKATISGPIKPRVISVEYNAMLPHTSTLAFTPRQLNTFKPGLYWSAESQFVAPGSFQRRPANDVSFCRAFGTSLGALDLVAKEHGYSLVGVVPPLDAFFVRNDELKGSAVKPITAPEYVQGTNQAASRAAFNPCTSPLQQQVARASVDYRVWQATKGNEEAAMKAAQAQIAQYFLH